MAVVALLFIGSIQIIPPARPAHAVISTDHTTFWNTVLLDTYRQLRLDPASPTRISRSGAIMHVAMYDAANSVLCARLAADCLGQPYVIRVPGSGDFHTALDYAAYTALTNLYPAGQFPALATFFQDKLAEAQDGIPSSPEQAAGRSVGEQAARAILQDRANDGADAPMSYTFDGVPGAHQQIGGNPPVTPQWGALQPFAMTSGATPTTPTWHPASGAHSPASARPPTRTPTAGSGSACTGISMPTAC
ncbi:hypothetical protein LDL48_01415 [Wangella sp. NEAU-J3]|nr:hypothetical protein [Jidongwangia harbinensis]